MRENRHIWQVWAKQLHRWGLQEWAASLLETAGPLSILGGQTIYIVQPFINSMLPHGHLDELAGLLNDSEQSREFITYLREADPR